MLPYQSDFMAPMTDQTDLQALQTALAHHERQIQDLSDIVMEQRKDIDRIRRLLDKTGQKLADLEQGATEGRAEGLSATEQALRDKPPHY
jgi:uncharacterized coiled-coil protein SlyX